jgi:hypothetical protein
MLSLVRHWLTRDRSQYIDVARGPLHPAQLRRVRAVAAREAALAVELDRRIARG